MAEGRSKKVVWVIGIALVFTLTFCVGFVFFYTREKEKATAAQQPPPGKPLPAAELVDEANQVLPDSALRSGKVVLVFMTPDCDACLREAEFLRTLVGKRPDVPFYGVVSYGDKATALRESRDKFPFKVFYDEHLKLAGELGIRRVPIKLYVEDGLIKKSWGGATVEEDKQREFVGWLEKL